MLPTWIRWLAFGFGAVLILGGFAAASAGGESVAGVEAIVVGAAAMIVAVLQRPRYRSSAAEQGHEDPGPGGGEDGSIEPRFLPTNEVFVDPTSHRLMRVFVDPRSGERRYRAEG
ncbi:MAG: hypothetical protein ABSD62_01735 [Candidatus Limnocylindrales bacterium]|jgi:hypothetical protein